MHSNMSFLLLLLLLTQSSPHPLPEEQEPETSPPPEETTPSYSPPSLIIADDPKDTDSEDPTDKQKRHRPTPSPEELEERRKALIKALGGGGGGDDDDDGSGGGGQIAASIAGLGSLATDVVSLVSANSAETFKPLRDARERARMNFPDFGTQLNRYLKNGREYTTRAYRGLVKNAGVKLTNVIRFMLSAVTRLASTIGGMYQVLVSLLDVTTRGIGTGARVGSKFLSTASNATVYALARGTGALRNLAESGDLVKPVNKAVMVGRELSKGLSEDFFDKVEWTQEGLNSKIELIQSLAPNFLLRAHENLPESTTTQSPSSYGPPPSDEIGGYSKLTQNNDDMVLLSLASTAAELMQRGGREADMSKMESTTSTLPPDGPPQGLLNDIFGLQEQIDELKKDLNGIDLGDGSTGIVDTTTESVKKGDEGEEKEKS